MRRMSPSTSACGSPQLWVDRHRVLHDLDGGGVAGKAKMQLLVVLRTQLAWRDRDRLIKAFSETDFTEDLKRFDVPTLVVHGDDD